jgi:hypothetical protein
MSHVLKKASLLAVGAAVRLVAGRAAQPHHATATTTDRPLPARCGWCRCALLLPRPTEADRWRPGELQRDVSPVTGGHRPSAARVRGVLCTAARSQASAWRERHGAHLISGMLMG